MCVCTCGATTDKEKAKYVAESQAETDKRIARFGTTAEEAPLRHRLGIAYEGDPDRRAADVIALDRELGNERGAR